MNKLSRLDPDMAENIPELPRIVAFRNILIHGYANVDDRLVWGVVESRLEPLLDVIAALLSVESASGGFWTSNGATCREGRRFSF